MKKNDYRKFYIEELQMAKYDASYIPEKSLEDIEKNRLEAIKLRERLDRFLKDHAYLEGSYGL